MTRSLMDGNRMPLSSCRFCCRTTPVPCSRLTGRVALTVSWKQRTKVSQLQQACAAWYNHTYQRALAWAPDILPVTIARWTEGSKNIRPTGFTPAPQSPHLGGRTNREWHNYEVRSGAYHLGDTLYAGHFRAFWFHPARGALYFSDDSVRPKPATASDRKQVAEGCYLLFLVKHQ